MTVRVVPLVSITFPDGHVELYRFVELHEHTSSRFGEPQTSYRQMTLREEQKIGLDRD